MTNSPISRIPLEADSPPLHQIVHAEIAHLVNQKVLISDEIIAMMHYCRNDDSIMSTTLDWAMQIRNALGLDWASSLHAALALSVG